MFVVRTFAEQQNNLFLIDKDFASKIASTSFSHAAKVKIYLSEERQDELHSFVQLERRREHRSGLYTGMRGIRQTTLMRSHKISHCPSRYFVESRTRARDLVCIYDHSLLCLTLRETFVDGFLMTIQSMIEVAKDSEYLQNVSVGPPYRCFCGAKTYQVKIYCPWLFLKFTSAGLPIGMPFASLSYAVIKSGFIVSSIHTA